MIHSPRAWTNQDYFKMRIDWISELLSNGHRHCWDGAKNLNRNYFHVEGVTAPCLYWELSKAAFELFWFCAKAWGQEVLMMTPIKYLSYAIGLQERCLATRTCVTRLCGACTWRGGQGLQRRRQPRRFCVSQVKSEYFNFLEVIDTLQKLSVGAECAKICCWGSYWQGPCCSGKKVWFLYLDWTGYSLSLLHPSRTTSYFNSWKAHLGCWLNLGISWCPSLSTRW